MCERLAALRAAMASMAAAWSRASRASAAERTEASKDAAQPAMAARNAANRSHMLAVCLRGGVDSDQGQPRATGENVCSILVPGWDRNQS